MFLKIVITAVFAASIVAAQDFDYEEDLKPRPAPPRLRPGFSGPAQGPKQAAPAPVAILKQINKHNEDGSYTYGYESADGTFKIETKLSNGEVKGKYGYRDDQGKIRVVEYGATKYGFAPQGEGITVPPPTLVDETTLKDGRINPDYQEQYAEPEPVQRAQVRPRPQQQPFQQESSFDNYPSQLQFAPAPQHSPSPVPQRPSSFPGASLTTDIEFGPQPKQATRSFAPPAPAYRPAPAPQQTFSFEPAPIEEEDNYAEPAPSFQPFKPAPVSRPAPVQYSRPQQQYTQAVRSAPPPPPAQRESGGGGILDQLAKDYALPSGGSPALHDISFGYY